MNAFKMCSNPITLTWLKSENIYIKFGDPKQSLYTNTEIEHFSGVNWHQISDNTKTEM
jgi:hypothetical protein